MENIGGENLGSGSGKLLGKKKGPRVKIGYEDEEEEELEYEYEDETRGNRNNKEMIKASTSTGAVKTSFGEAARKR